MNDIIDPRHKMHALKWLEGIGVTLLFTGIAGLAMAQQASDAPSVNLETAKK